MNFKIDMPYTVNSIIEELYDNGYEAFIVGGCVRDKLLGATPNDWDICTDAKPKDVINIFKDRYKVIETGLKHGTVTLVDKNNGQYEVTTYRIDGEYENNRKPKQVEFTSSLREDLSRRDFTINAMAYNHRVGLIDYFDGVYDLGNKIIRCVGNAEERFKEDALRILRAYRFMARLGFIVEMDIIKSSGNLAYLLENISVERIREEFNKILLGKQFILPILKIKNIFKYIIPEIEVMYECKQNNPYHILDVWGHTMLSVCESKNDLIIRLALLFHDIGKAQCKTVDENGIDHFYNHSKISKEIAEKALRRLKYDNKTIENILILIENHDCELNSSKSIKRMLNKIGEDNFRNLIEVKYADIKAQNPEYFKDRELALNEVREKLNIILEQQQCFSIKDLKINGRDIINLGIKQGKEIGIILNKLLEVVIDDASLNNREYLIDYARRIRENI